MFLVPLLLVAVLGAASAGPAQAAHSVPGPTYGVAAGTRLDRLPFLEPGTMAGGVSSLDRDTFDATHGNHDLGNFLSTRADGNVMLDQAGPGCVGRGLVTRQQAAVSGHWVHGYF